MIEQAGIRKLRRRRRYLKVLAPLEVSDGDRRIGIYPADRLHVRCLVDYAHPLVGRQQVELDVNRWFLYADARFRAHLLLLS